MTIVHRHLDIAPDTPPEELPLDALDDLLDRGDLDDWRALAAAIRRDPRGRIADRVVWLCRSHPMYGTSQLWQEFIARLRGNGTGSRAMPLAELRKRRGRSQADVARALGISQSDVSKIERRADVRVSTLQRYVRALGGSVNIGAHFPSSASGEPPETLELSVGADAPRSRATAPGAPAPG